MTRRTFPCYLAPFGPRPRLVTTIGAILSLLLVILKPSLDVQTRTLVAWGASCST